MTGHLRSGVIPAYVALCLVLGGSSVGHWANMVLQLLAIGIIAWAALTPRPMPLSRSAMGLLALVGATLALVAIQLVPLPPAIWSALPGRDFVVKGYALLGEPLPWLPISLAPYQTLSSALWFLPAFAVILGIVRLGAFRSSWIATAVVVITVTAVMLGALQVSSGDPVNSLWYLYRITNHGVATGFFANSNHMATLLVVAVPFLAALFAAGRRRNNSVQASSGLVAMLAGGAVVILLGLALNGSLAGLGLGVPVVAASGLILASVSGRKARWSLVLLAFVSIASVAIIFSTPLHNNLTTDGAITSAESRRTTFGKSLTAAADFAPFGSGLGTFVRIYPRYEDPAAVNLTYVNHVHSDFIELALETGVPGMILVAAFLLWWGRRIVQVWRGAVPDYYARAASIASAAILAHSLVDYPLRTAAIAAIFAMCLALLAERPVRVEPRARPGDRKVRHLSVTKIA